MAAETARREAEVVGDIAELVSKSLVMAEADDEPRLRLPETARAYALEKLGESGEHDMIARRHAEYYRDLCERVEAEWDTLPTAEWLASTGVIHGRRPSV